MKGSKVSNKSKFMKAIHCCEKAAIIAIL